MSIERPFRRFGQFIRQRNHFGETRVRVNHPYQMRTGIRSRETKFPGVEELVLKKGKV